MDRSLEHLDLMIASGTDSWTYQAEHQLERCLSSMTVGMPDWQHTHHFVDHRIAVAADHIVVDHRIVAVDRNLAVVHSNQSDLVGLRRCIGRTDSLEYLAGSHLAEVGRRSLVF